MFQTKHKGGMKALYVWWIGGVTKAHKKETSIYIVWLEYPLHIEKNKNSIY